MSTFVPWWMRVDAQLRLLVTDSGDSCYAYYVPTIGTWLHRRTHPDGTIDVYHGPLGREWRVATIRPKWRLG